MNTKKAHTNISSIPVLDTPGEVSQDPFASVPPPPLAIEPVLTQLELAQDFPEQEHAPITLGLIWSYRQVILMCIVISFGGFLFGWDTGTIGGILLLPSLLRCIGTEVEGAYTLGTVHHGLLVGMYHIGCITGGFTLVRLADFKGRRIPIMLCMGVYSLGNLIQLLTSQTGRWYQFAIGRLVSGLCIGSLGVLVPMFLSETSPAVIRGSLTTLYLIMICTGLMLGAIVVYLLKNAYGESNTAWIVSLAIPMGVSMLVFGGILHAPESARYLVSQGDIPGAEKSLRRIHETDIPNKISNLEAKFALEKRANTIGYWEMLSNKKHLKRVLTGVVLMFLQQMSGIDYFFYFGTQLFYSVGLNDSYVTMVILAVVNYFTAWASMLIVERFGRKKTLLFGSAACFVTLMVYAIVGATMVKLDADATENRVPGIVMITFTCLYIIMFGSTWAGCGNVVVTEMFPLHIRSKGMGMSIAFNWGANFFIAFCTPIVTAEIHYYFGLVFAGCMFVSFWFVLFFVKETKGILLEEIDGLYEKKELKAV